MSTTIEAPDGQPRCSWVCAAPEFLEYHDTEWGFPVGDDFQLFEKLTLESFQSGLSWRTILMKRENFRSAFCDFDFEKIARFSDKDIDRLLADKGIVRHRGKIEAAINNAKRAQEIAAKEGSLAAFVWRYEPTEDQLSEPQSATTSPESIALSKDLKRLGWKFFGPTTAFALMQAMGLINDHAEGCVLRPRIENAREGFKSPALSR